MRNEAKLTRTEITFEGALHIFDRARFNEEPREMRAADEFVVSRECPRALPAAGDAERIERGDDLAGPALPAPAGCGKAGGQFSVVRVNAQADDVQRVAAPRD